MIGALVALGAAGSGSVAFATPAAPLRVFRVDVSKHPHIGLVVTVPGSAGRLHDRDFAVTVRGRHVTSRLGRLSPHDLQIVLAPDAGLSAGAFQAERAAMIRFLVRLGRGSRTALVDPHRAPTLTPHLTRDPISVVAAVAHMADGAPRAAAERVTEALAAFTSGAKVRRTVVLFVGPHERRLDPRTADLLRSRMVASGTELYVVDLSGGATDYARLATDTGGLAITASAGSFGTALDRVLADLHDQYYLRFADTAPLPGRIGLAVRAGARTSRTTVHLPVANPIAPALPVLPPPKDRPARWDRPLVWSAGLLIVAGLCYGMGMLVVSRRNPRRMSVPGGVPDDFFFVFLLPCLNEERVILASLERLLSMPGDNFAVMVIDDGSDDGTAQVVGSVPGDRVWLLCRVAPNARQGKGEALNAAIGDLLDAGRLAGRDPDKVIVVVVDADGRLESRAIGEVTPYFADPTVGAVQIGVRINNRDRSLLARMQDMEFVIYTEVFQRGRRHLGSVGLGGNGQFMRLSALLTLGRAPWTRSLTDDLDLGVRLLASGWRNEYCSTAAVHQQGVVEVRRLIRQRSRWFQGHLQSWKLIPTVLRDVPGCARVDLFYHLTSPALLLIASLLSASFLLALVDFAVSAMTGHNPVGWWMLTTYALTFGPALSYGYVYWQRERGNGMSRLRTAALAHLYVCYGLMWYASGWWAVARTLRGSTGWAKTDRVVELPTEPVAPPEREKVTS